MKRIFAALFLSVAVVKAQEVRPAIPVNSGPVVVTPNARSVPAVPVAPATPVVPVAPEAPPLAPLPPAPVDPSAESWNDLAQYLAGMPVQGGSPLAPLQRERAYVEHLKNFSTLWRRYQENHMVPIRQWIVSDLRTRVPSNLPVYYFFGGPDAISALAFFPDAPVYILGGLEPVGMIGAPQTLDEAGRAEALENLRKSTEVILNFGHFITKDMKEDLDRSAFRGVLPVITTFVALSGGTILSLDYVGVTSNGALQNFGTTYRTGSGTVPGIKIVFQRNASAAPQTLYYLQADASDGAFKGSGGVARWVGSFGQGVVYLKAASYLMHETYFSNIRNFLMGHAVAVLQDDSGIPFKYFLGGGWQIYFYGTYSGTLDIFRKYYQADLLVAFQSGAAQPLPFGTGYKWKKGESNLMLAVRAAQVPKAEAVAPAAQ